MSGPPLHRSLRNRFPEWHDLSDAEFLKDLRERRRRYCKPCWELKYCPYGPEVEDYPLLPETRVDATAHIEYLNESLRTGILGGGSELDDWRRAWFAQTVAEFDPGEYPVSIPSEIADLSCTVFGHVCPVFFTAESATETAEVRQRGRSIPFAMRSRVARRDNYTCQSCGKHLRDEEVEFDHVIPLSKGGSSEEHNLRVACMVCNRSKGSRFLP